MPKKKWHKRGKARRQRRTGSNSGAKQREAGFDNTVRKMKTGASARSMGAGMENPGGRGKKRMEGEKRL